MTDGEGRVPDLPPAFNLVLRDEVDSTNILARQLIAESAPDGTLVVAARQTTGRGRQGRVWQSPAGNLYMSLVLRPQGPLGHAAQLSLVVGLAMADAIAALLPQGSGAVPAVKWPNDVLLVRDGVAGKLAGILLESAEDQSGTHVIAGIGANVRVHPGPTDGVFPPAVLAECPGAHHLYPLDVVEAFAPAFAARRAVWARQGLGGLKADWLARAYGLGQMATVRYGATPVTGRFDGIDDDGTLLLAQEDGTIRRLAAGEVVFAKPPVTGGV
ncbi:biotin--[acetyl-CoA-carboxylase] ligase [Tistrella bauzanensis]|uniref:biotin--[biotin carboxyl-carrier protein] ligase n=1 Tax=Tistrella bauzanensis TaxID=657419 RepID=A0ABQ1I862_9PROT|nr:biotin--[acetyl-CoA-carboxylase] ligase [Tistrella bauzanensis]GGB26478.1 biotin--[acetyl-CoA-carboxylase] ligase [Tistrella bauzanensis]